MPKTLFLLCGEPSGETYAARVAGEFRRRFPDAPMEGIGGPRLEAQGVKLLRDYADISVVGFTEVLSHLPERTALFELFFYFDVRRPSVSSDSTSHGAHRLASIVR